MVYHVFTFGQNFRIHQVCIFSWHIRQHASFMTHFGLQSSPFISEIKHIIFFIIPFTYSKTADGFRLQPGDKVYFSSSIFLPSLTTKHHSTEQIPTVTCCTSLLFKLLPIFPSPGMSSHSKTIKAYVQSSPWYNLPFLFSSWRSVLGLPYTPSYSEWGYS